MDRIKSEGPLQSRDFDEARQRTVGWRNSKPSKDALEFLFHEGKLMITRRINFQKVYDLTERVLPAGIDISEPTESQYYKYLILTSVRSNGFANEGEITYLRKYDRKKFRKVLNQLVEDKTIVNLKVEGLNDQEYFSEESKINKIKKSVQKGVHFLSPFDNIIIQRKRVRDLFNFEYLLECYVPETKRKFGYFCLPVLLGDKFLGKIDAKREVKDKTFKVKKIFWEDKNVSISDLEVKLSEFAEFTGCNKVVGFE